MLRGKKAAATTMIPVPRGSAKLAEMAGCQSREGPKNWSACQTRYGQQCVSQHGHAAAERSTCLVGAVVRIPGREDESCASGSPPQSNHGRLGTQSAKRGQTPKSEAPFGPFRLLVSDPFSPSTPEIDADAALAVDPAPLQAQKSEGHGTGGDDTPLVRIHGPEVTDEVAPGIKKPERERKICDDGGEHSELGWDVGVLQWVTGGISRVRIRTFCPARRSVRKPRLRQIR